MSRKTPSEQQRDRRALLAVAIQFFVNGALFASFIPRLPEIRDQVGISIGRIGLLLSLAGACGLLGSMLVAPAIDRFGTRRVMLVAGTLVSLCLPLVGFGDTQLILFAGLAGMAIFDVPVDVAMNMQGSWLSARRTTPVMNRLHGLWSLGTVVGGVSSARIAASGVSLTTHLVGAGIVLLGVLGFVSRGLLRQDEHHPDRTQATSDPSPTTSALRPSVVLVLFAFAGLFSVVVEVSAIDWAAFRFTDDFGSTAGFSALGYVSVTAGMTFGRFGGDWATVRLGEQNLTYASLGLTGVGLSIASTVPNRYFSIAGYALAGLGIATMLPMLYDSAAKHPGRKGAGLGALSAGIRSGGLVIPFIVGGLAAGDWRVGTAIVVVALPSLIGFFVVARPLVRSNA